MVRTITVLCALIFSQQAIAEQARTLIFVGTENAAGGNAGLVTSQTTGVRSNNSIDPIGHAFSLADVDVAQNFVGIWENSEKTNPVTGPKFFGVMYGKALPGSSGQIIGFLKRQPVPGGVQVHIARDCTSPSDNGLLVIRSGLPQFESCTRLQLLGYLAP